MKTTKEQLIKENAVLTQKLELAKRKDEEVRENLTSILLYSPQVYNSYSQKPKIMSWIDIAFNMGELRADANYSMLIDSREELKREIELLKNPKPL
jgi:hypothetical protein